MTKKSNIIALDAHRKSNEILFDISEEEDEVLELTEEDIICLTDLK